MLKKCLSILILLFLLVIPVQAIQLMSIIYDVTPTTATIDFVLEVSNSSKIVLEYGTDETYGKRVDLMLSKKKVRELLMTVPVTINNLKPNTEYHYRVIIHDTSENLDMVSLDSTFTTEVQNSL